MTDEGRERLRAIVRVFVVLAMVTVGTIHFVNPDPFVRIVPKELPFRFALVIVSGVFEIALALALLPRATRRLAGIGLVLLYVAVFPANLNMAFRGIELNPDHPLPAWVVWGRLPFQLLFIALALYVSKMPKANPR